MAMLPEIVELGNKWSESDLLVHDSSDYVIASMLQNMTYSPDFPDPAGVFYKIDAPTYEDLVADQIKTATKSKPKSSVQQILDSGDTWVVKQSKALSKRQEKDSMGHIDVPKNKY